MVILTIIVIIIKNFNYNNNICNSKTLKHNFLRIFTFFATQKKLKEKKRLQNKTNWYSNLTKEVYMKPPERHPDYN